MARLDFWRRKPEEPQAHTVMLNGREVPFTITRSRKRRRTIAFTVEPGTGLRVMAPMRASATEIRSILQKRAGWIARRMKERETAVPRSFTDGETVSYLGHACRLRVTQDASRPQGCRFLPGRFEVNIPDTALSGQGLQEEARLEVLLWLKKRAKAKFAKRLDLWAQRLGVSYRKLIVTSPERLWGSCNAQNVIRLNWRLIMAPLPLLDYVAAHELAHVPHKNHSKRFWRFLAAAMPDYETRRKHLRRIGHGLIL